jgi:multidrug efflux pump subunit AcrA (membrane-fusion protein)
MTAAMLVATALLGCGWFFAKEKPPQTATPEVSGPTSDPPEQEEAAASVKVIHPRNDPAFGISVEQPAFVRAYYQGDLMARAAGPIKVLDVDIGDHIHKGQDLVQIEVTDLEEEVLQKEAIVRQRLRELDLTRTNVKTAEARVRAAEGMVQLKQADVLKADADERFRGKELKRFEGLAAGSSPAVTPDIVDERTLLFESAKSASAAARADVTKAKADFEEAQAKLEAARADVNLADALVAVARKDRDRVKALLGYATITAPFDGVVTHRYADPGSFVQNATTAHTDPILTVARTDIVTVYMKVPDNYAPFVTNDTEAIITLGVLPGWEIHAKVTRFSPSLENPEHDRTMRVEVDLFNGNHEDYEKLLAVAAKSNNAGLKGHTPPVFPEVKGKSGAGLSGRLLPGMFGKMKLILRSFKDALLVPSTAVVSQGGRSYVYLVKDGKALLTPVEVEVDDGRLAKLLVIERSGGRETRRELRPEDEVVASNQGELSDGQAVKAIATDW